MARHEDGDAWRLDAWCAPVHARRPPACQPAALHHARPGPGLFFWSPRAPQGLCIASNTPFVLLLPLSLFDTATSKWCLAAFISNSPSIAHQNNIRWKKVVSSSDHRPICKVTLAKPRPDWPSGKKQTGPRPRQRPRSSITVLSHASGTSKCTARASVNVPAVPSRLRVLSAAGCE